MAVVAMSTIRQTGTKWIDTSDLDFVLPDSKSLAPIGHATRFIFKLGEIFFVLKVYIVKSTNY